jgi:hypothetical protein
VGSDVVPLGPELDPAAAIQVDYDDQDLLTRSARGRPYAVPDAPIGKAAFFTSEVTGLRDCLARDRTLTIQRNPELKLYSRLDETEEASPAAARRSLGS